MSDPMTQFVFPYRFGTETMSIVASREVATRIMEILNKAQEAQGGD